MGSLLAALATILVTALAALLALPYVVDWNDYKAQFEIHAAKLVGRPVRIEGQVDLKILPVPMLRLRGVRVADEFGKFERPFAEVEDINAVLALPPLLNGTIQAKSIELDQPIIRLKIDEFGEGSWQSVGPYGLDIPLPVRQVVLDRVGIKDGAIELRGPRDASASRIDRISGAFSAESLSGPFRFAGTGVFGDGGKEIKISAGTFQPDASVRVKASLRSDDGVSLYQLDGDIKGLDGQLHYVGPVSARLALDQEAKQAQTAQLAEPMAGRAVEMRANAKLTLDDAKFDDIALTVTRNDRPQSVSGSAYASWGATPRLDMSVEAAWLDFDEMLLAHAAGGPATPAAAIGVLPRVFEGWFFKPRQGEIKAKIQQASFGGDVVEGLEFTASHDTGGWRIDTLTARLPGETDIDIQGALPGGDELSFNGNFTLKGANLSRLLRWAAPSLGVVEAGSEQNFSLSSGLTLTPAKLAFQEAKGTLGESSFSFDLVHDYGKDSRLLLALDSERLDLRGLYAAHGAARKGQADDPAQVPLDPAPGDDSWSAQTVPSRKTSLADVLWTVFKAEQSNVSLLIAQLQLPDFEARDVRSAFRYENGTFDIKELNLATTDGLKVRADGQINGFDSKPDGALNLSIDAPSAQSVTNLARLAGFDSVSKAARGRIEALAPFRLTGALQAVAKQSAVKLTLGGSAGGSELSFTGRLNGDLDHLEKARVDVSGLIGNGDGHRLIAQLAPEVPMDKAGAQNGAGYLKVSALGAIDAGLASRIELRTPEASGQFEGEIAGLGKPSWSFNGDLDLRAGQAATALSMLRLSPGGAPVTGPIDLKAAVSKSGDAYKVSALSLNIGGEVIRGSVEVDASGERARAAIDISAETVFLPKVAAYLVDWDRQDVTSQIASIASGQDGIWPNQAFAIAALQSADGSLKVSARAVRVSDGLSLADGQLEASLQDGVLTVSRLEGQLWGGTVSASGSLRALQGHASVSANLKADKIELAELTRTLGGNTIAKGKAGFEMSLEGQGFSPRGLISVLAGSGALKLAGGAMEGLSPGVLKKIASTYLTQEIPDKERLLTKIEKDLRQGKLEFKALTAPLAVKDGVIRLSRPELKGDDYRIAADLLIDLASLRLDSEWDVAHAGKTDGGEELPPVRLVFAGPLTGLSSLKPSLDADQFERYLTIKRMDQDMDKLEKLERQRGVARGPERQRAPAGKPGGDTAAGVGVPAPNVPPGQQAIPTQSLLRAPPVVIGEPDAKPARALPDTGSDAAPQAPGGGWAADTEKAGVALPPAGGAWQAEPQTAAPASGDFEARIREVLRARQNETQGAPPSSRPQ